jgi:hypothetical protein
VIEDVALYNMRSQLKELREAIKVVHAQNNETMCTLNKDLGDYLFGNILRIYKIYIFINCNKIK